MDVHINGQVHCFVVMSPSILPNCGYLAWLISDGFAYDCSGKANIQRPVESFWDDANRVQAAQEEEHLVREFKENLKYNLQQVSNT